MRVAVAGASGFLGDAICAELRSAGHSVVTIGRSRNSQGPDIVWDPAKRQLDAKRLEGCDAVVNLTGENIGQRWTEGTRARILASRVDPTALLASVIASLPTKPEVFVSASAVGFYGDTGDREVDESGPKGSGFLADVVSQWEASAEPARQAGIRVVHPRTGLVMSPKGGVLAKLLLPFKLGAGGKIGSGRQWMTWIALTDVVRAFRFLIETTELRGPVNVASPTPVRNEEFTTALAGALHRPAVAFVPEFAVKLAFGAMGQETLLAGQRVVPRRLLDAGFDFKLPTIAEALRTELSNA